MPNLMDAHQLLEVLWTYAEEDPDISRRLERVLDNIEAIIWNAKIELGYYPDWPLKKCIKCKRETMQIVDGYCPDHLPRHVESAGEKSIKYKVMLKENGLEKNIGMIKAYSYPDSVAQLSVYAAKHHAINFVPDRSGMFYFFTEDGKREVYLKKA